MPIATSKLGVHAGQVFWYVPCLWIKRKPTWRERGRERELERARERDAPRMGAEGDTGKETLAHDHEASEGALMRKVAHAWNA